MDLFDAMGLAEIHGDPIALFSDTLGRPHAERVTVDDGGNVLGRDARAELPAARRQPPAGEARRLEIVEDDVGAGFGAAVTAVEHAK